MKAEPTKDSMIKQINLLLEALPETEVKEIYETLLSMEFRNLKLYVVVKHECK